MGVYAEQEEEEEEEVGMRTKRKRQRAIPECVFCLNGMTCCNTWIFITDVGFIRQIVPACVGGEGYKLQ